MNIRELNSYVREKCGSPSSALLHPEEIDLNLLEEISLRQSQMIAVGKQLRTAVAQLAGPFARSGVFSAEISTGWLEVLAAASQASGLLQVVDGGAPIAASGYLTVKACTARATGYLTIRQGVASTGSLEFVSNPVNNETISINGFTITFRTTPSNGINQVKIGGNVEATAANLVTLLNASSSPLLNVATYASGGGSSPGTGSGSIPVPPAMVSIVYDTYGTAGDAYTLADSLFGAIVAGAPTLTGGVDGITDGEEVNVDGVACFFTSGPGTSSPAEIPIYIEFDQDAAQTATNMAAALNASTSANLSCATYTAVPGARGEDARLSISFDALGFIGNMYALYDSDLGAVTASGPHLTGGLGGVIEGETIDVDGAVFTFSNLTFDATHIRFSSDPAYTATWIATMLNLSGNVLISVATYEALPGARGEDARVNIVYDTGGVGGNSFTLFNSSHSNVTRSGATLTGGVDSGITDGETINVNDVTWTFSNAVGALNIPFGGDYVVNAANIATKLNASVNPLISAATYTAIGRGLITVVYDLPGALGNLFAIANSSLDAVVASGATLTGGEGGITEGETLDVDGVTYTFTTFARGGTFILFGADASVNAARIAAALSQSEDPLITVAAYAADGRRVNIGYRTVGSAGNLFTLADSSGGAVVASGATLTGGSNGLDEKIPPDYVRIDLNGSGVYDLMQKVNDVDGLTLAEEQGRLAILFYGSDLNYALSWDPTGDEAFEFWYDRDVSSLAQVAAEGTQLPKRFDFAVGEAVAIKCLPVIVMRDESKRTFADLQGRILEGNVMRWEREWDQFLFQSATAGSVTQRGPYRTAPRRRVRHFPY